MSKSGPDKPVKLAMTLFAELLALRLRIIRFKDLVFFNLFIFYQDQ